MSHMTSLLRGALVITSTTIRLLLLNPIRVWRFSYVHEYVRWVLALGDKFPWIREYVYPLHNMTW